MNELEEMEKEIIKNHKVRFRELNKEALEGNGSEFKNDDKLFDELEELKKKGTETYFKKN